MTIKPQFIRYLVRPVWQTHSEGNAEYPRSCSHDLLPHTQWQWTLLAAPEGQEGQAALGHLEDQEDHVVPLN